MSLIENILAKARLAGKHIVLADVYKRQVPGRSRPSVAVAIPFF